MSKPHIQAYRSGGRLIYVLYAGRNDRRVLGVSDSVRDLSTPRGHTRLSAWIVQLICSGMRKP